MFSDIKLVEIRKSHLETIVIFSFSKIINLSNLSHTLNLC